MIDLGDLKIALRFGAVGLEMGAAVAIGCVGGWWLDKTFDTKPYLMIVMLLLGIVAAFMMLYKAAKAYQRMG